MLTEILFGIALVLGVFFCVVGVIGLVRFPDVYSRIHASGKVSTVGLIGLLIAAALALPEITLKLLALTLFMVFTAPVSGHAIASAAYRLGVPMHKPAQDDLEGKISTSGEIAGSQTNTLE